MMFALLPAAAAAAVVLSAPAEAASPFNMACAMEHCSLAMAGCMTNGDCLQAVGCSAECPLHDPSPEKLDYQRCVLSCSYSFDDPAYEKAMTCLNTHDCLTLPPLDNGTTPDTPFWAKCKADADIRPAQALSTASLMGGPWWAAVGLHPIYDCDFHCQDTTLTQTNATDMVWHLRSQVQRKDGSWKQIAEDWPFPAAEGGAFWLNHTDLGMEHLEHWHLLDSAADGSWVSLYYCGATGDWSYSGGIVFSKTRSLTDAQLADVGKSLMATVDISLPRDACILNNTACEDRRPAPADSAPNALAVAPAGREEGARRRAQSAEPAAAEVGGTTSCMLEHCSLKLAECIANKECRESMACAANCKNVPIADAGACVSLCTITYASKQADDLAACINSHECLPLPFPMNDTCKTPPSSLAQKFNMSALSDGGEWWVVYGHNPTADCHSCQRRHIHPADDAAAAASAAGPAWLYDYTLLVQAANGSAMNWTLHTPLSPTPDQLVSMESWKWPWGAGGLNFVEEWWVLDRNDAYTQVYYCCTMPDRGPSLQLEGGLILSHSKTVPSAALPRISALYAQMGVNFSSSFCEVNNACINPQEDA